MSIFKACDIRASYPDELQDEDAILLGNAIVSLQGSCIDFAKGQIKSSAGLRVVVGYGNGMGALTGPTLWAHSDSETRSLFDVVNGRFPNRSPNPAVQIGERFTKNAVGNSVPHAARAATSLKDRRKSQSARSHRIFSFVPRQPYA